MNTLRTANLKKAFGNVVALDDLTLSFPSIGAVAIIGPNGAGKTTLVNVITGNLRPDAGEVSFRGQVLTRLPPFRIARLGIARTFQELRLIRRASAIDNVMLARPNRAAETLLAALFPSRFARTDRAHRDAASDLLDFVGLAHAAHRLADELSYGQQKLLSFAMALAADAPVILLDEPVAGVDPRMTENILALLQEVKRSKLIIFIEHDMQAVRLAADAIIVMDQGKAIAQGPPQEVLSRPEIAEAYLG